LLRAEAVVVVVVVVVMVMVGQAMAGWTNAPLIRLRITRSGRAPRPLTSPRPKKPTSPFSTTAFAKGYREAYATVYDRDEYAAAIEQLRALGHDDHPNVANLIGYSYRKLGDYKLSQVWYERALKADPNHVLTWNYYGLWQIERGNREQAEYHFEPDRCDLRNRLRGI
jgi:tetratricopeptide (TPR) repeat protein